MDLNLDALKEEILRFLDASEFAVFRGHAGALDEVPVITWDSESFPDYRMFLDAAQRSGEKVVIFMTAVFDESSSAAAFDDRSTAADHGVWVAFSIASSGALLTPRANVVT